MALVDDRDDNASVGLRPMTPERAAERDAVLEGMINGEDEGDLSKVPRGGKKAPKAKEVAKVKPKRAPVADPDDPAFDEIDEDEELEEGILDPDPPKPKKPAKRAAPVEEDDDDDEPDEDEDEGDDSDTALADDDTDDDDDADDDEDDDEETAKSKAAIRALEKKSLAKIAARERRVKERERELRVEVERRESAFLREWEPRIERTKAIESIVEAAKRNPVGAVLQFAEEVAGVAGDDWELVGKTSYLKSPRAQADPKSREAGQRAMRDAETRSELEQVKQANKALQDRIDAREVAEANQRAVQTYMERVENSVTAETRLVRRMMKRNPDRARAELHALALEYSEQHGEVPSPAKLVRLKEKRERGRLLELGIDPASLFKQKKRAEGDADPAPKKAAPKKAPPANGKRLSGKELRADILAQLK